MRDPIELKTLGTHVGRLGFPAEGLPGDFSWIDRDGRPELALSYWPPAVFAVLAQFDRLLALDAIGNQAGPVNRPVENAWMAGHVALLEHDGEGVAWAFSEINVGDEIRRRAVGGAAQVETLILSEHRQTQDQECADG